MSLSYFCPSCGGKNIYQFNKPKFCSYCGVNFSSTPNQTPVQASQPQTQQPTPVSRPKITIIDNSRRKEPIVDIDGEENEENINGGYKVMSGLDVVISKPRNDGVSLGDLMNSPADKESGAVQSKGKKTRGRKKIMKSLPASFVEEARLSGRGGSQSSPNFGDGEE